MMDEKLRPFQRRFIKAVESSSYDTVALSGPRGLGKTFLAGHVLARALTPGDLPCLQRPVFVWFVDSVTGFKVITLIRPVPPARDCEVCGDVTCGTCEAADCPHGEDREFVP